MNLNKTQSFLIKWAKRFVASNFLSGPFYKLICPEFLVDERFFLILFNYYNEGQSQLFFTCFTLFE